MKKHLQIKRRSKCLPATVLLVVACLLVFIRPGVLTAKDKSARKNRPNFLVIISDDQRPDTIHALGNAMIQTPNLDQLVRRGSTFTRATCSSPLCVPSRAEILTGCDGFRNQVQGFRGQKLNQNLVFWGDAMQQGGYHSWYVGKWMNDGRPITRGYEKSRGLFFGGGKQPAGAVDVHGRPVTGYRGWIFQSDEGEKFPERGVGLTPNISKLFADAAIELIQSRPKDPFFLHVNFTAPHDPLLMPPGYEGMYNAEQIPLPKNFLPEHPFDHGNLLGRDEKLLPWPRTPQDVREDLAAYYAVISHMDHHIGRIIASLKATRQFDNTIIIFSSDHGLAIGSHGLRGKQNMYEHTIGQPLIMSGPGIRPNTRIDAACYLRDLYPTVCELAGIKIPATVEARSLAPVIRGESRAIYSHIFGYFKDTQRMIRTPKWKLIHYPKINRYQLFDLVNDSDEIKNLVADAKHLAVAEDLKTRLHTWEEERTAVLQENAR